MFFPEAPIVPERWDGRMKPGELQSGGYGFYYKDSNRVIALSNRMVLKDLEGNHNAFHQPHEKHGASQAL